MSIFAMLGMDGQSLIVYHYISMLCIVVEKYFGIIKENSLIINLSNFLHRKVNTENKGNHQKTNKVWQEIEENFSDKLTNWSDLPNTSS